MGSDIKTEGLKLRGQYDLILSFQVRNDNEIDTLKRKLQFNPSLTRERILLDEKYQYAHQLKTELTELDTKINKLICPKLF